MKNSNDPLLDEIVSFLRQKEQDKNDNMFIPREKVNEWMQSDDIEVLGAVFFLLTDRRYYSYIKPFFSVEDYHCFVRRYYERCFLENPDGEWSDSRYSAGWSLVSWFIGLWNDPKVPRWILDDIKKWLAQLYKNGHEELRICIETATLEHLLERRDMVKYFADWKSDPVLKMAYAKAMEWSINQQS